MFFSILYFLELPWSIIKLSIARPTWDIPKIISSYTGITPDVMILSGTEGICHRKDALRDDVVSKMIE